MNKGLKNEVVTALGLSALALLLIRKPRAAAGLGLTAGTFALLGNTKKDIYRNRTVVITGGSRGLGLALAKEFVQKDARVVLLARDSEELERARHSILFGRPRAHVITSVCDVTKKDQVERCFADVVAKWGSIDILVNNAGAILVGPFDSLKREDFEAQMELHLYAVIQNVQAVLPYFRRQRRGRIVNICSMGGKVAVPHMLPYDTSKFALAGFSQGLAAELRQENITVTTVYPTLMHTGSPIQAVFKGDYEKEYAWFAAGDNFPGVSMPAKTAAKKILQAVEDGKAEFSPSALGQLRMGLGVAFPELMAFTMSLMSRLMPNGKGREYRTGAQSSGYFQRSAWSYPLRVRAKEVEQEWNQAPKSDAKHNLGLLH